MYNPSKKVTEILSKYLEFDPEQLQLGIWSGDLSLSDVNLRGDAIYPKINRMKKSPSGRDPLMLKIVEGTIGHFRIQIPWKRLVWGQGEVIVDIKGVNIIVAFESREETEARQKAAETNGESSEINTQDDDDEPVKKSKEFRKIKQKLLKEAEMRLLQGHHLATWLTHVIKKELSMEVETKKNGDEKLVKGFEKWMKKASSNFVWRFLSGLKLNIEGFKLVVVQDDIEIGLVMPDTHVLNQGKSNSQRRHGDEDQEKTKDDATPSGFGNNERTDNGDQIEKTIKANGVSIYAKRQASRLSQQHQHETSPMVLQPDDYILRPVDFSFSFNFFYPHANSDKRKAGQGGATRGFPDSDTLGGSSQTSSKRRRGKRDKLQLPKSVDGTAETDLVSSFAPEYGGIQRQRSTWTANSDDQVALDAHSKLPPHQRRATNRTMSRSTHNLRSLPSSKRGIVGTRSAPLVRHDDLGSVYASAIAETAISQNTARFDAQMNCGEIRVMCSSRHLEIVNKFFAVGARMRNGRPTSTIAEVMVKGEKAINRRSTMNTASTGLASEKTPPPQLERKRTIASGFSSIHRPRERRVSMGMRNEVAAKARSRRSLVIRSWWHYAYGVVAHEIQKRKKRRDNFREKFVSFDWEKQKQKRNEYVNFYLALQLDVGHHVNSDDTVMSPDAEKLLAIEDELPIEQVLLYRSIARALHMHGIESMPPSLSVLYKDYMSDFAVERRRASGLGNLDTSMKIGRRLSVPQYTLHGLTYEDDGNNLLSMIGSRSNNARRYRSYLEQDNVQLFDEPTKAKKRVVSEKEKARSKRAVRAASMGLGNITEDREYKSYSRQAKMDELGDSKVSFAFDASEDPPDSPQPPPKRKTDNTDVRTVRTFRTTKSAKTRASAIAGTVVDNIYDESSIQAAKFSLSLYFKTVELMIVADEQNLPPADKPVARLSQDDSKSGSSDDVSELSFLSEEDFFREQDSAPIAALEEEVNDNPMLSSTDFLLFGLPENLLLHVTLSPLRCSMLGRSGGSKNVNFTIGSITASGEGCDNLLAIGSRASPTPVPVVSLSKRGSTANSDKNYRISAPSTGPKEAVKFSVVIQEGQKAVQADMAKVHVSLDILLLFKLLQFHKTSDVGAPQRMLPKSAREEARLFILRENPRSPLAGINSSVRIHGVDISVPVDPMQHIDSESSSSQSGSNEGGDHESTPSVCLSTRIIEMYSGTAVNDLCGGAEAGVQVGSLEMLDLNELVASQASLSSHHCVSTNMQEK